MNVYSRGLREMCSQERTEFHKEGISSHVVAKLTEWLLKVAQDYKQSEPEEMPPQPNSFSVIFFFTYINRDRHPLSPLFYNLRMPNLFL